MQYKPILSASLSIHTGINAKYPVLIILGTLSGIELRTGGHTVEKGCKVIEKNTNIYEYFSL
jgi:hypothetical protein